jgi:hypothetical protein
MKSFKQSAAFLWAVGVAALVVGPARADPPEGLHGSWHDRPAFNTDWQVGGYQSVVDPKTAGLAILKTMPEDNRRFTGTIELIPIVSPAEPIQGTLSASGEVTFVWSMPKMGMGEAHGMAISTSSGDMLLLEYKVRLADGSVDRGTLQFRALPGPAP